MSVDVNPMIASLGPRLRARDAAVYLATRGPGNLRP
jgi:hypothetical protein